jgi:endoglucanase
MLQRPLTQVAKLHKGDFVNRLTRRGRWSALAAGAAAVGAVAFGVSSLAPSASAAIVGELYAPTSSAETWVAANPNDSRAAVIREKLVGQPLAVWLTSPNVALMQTRVTTAITAAAGKIPQFVFYTIPNRDCGGASAGGATDLAAWSSWVQSITQTIGTATVIIILEPDSLALQTCLSAEEVTQRDNAIAAAVTTIKTGAPNAKVYLDAGHSAWNSADKAAARLTAAGVAAADGFYSNVSNFRLTQDEVAFGQAVLAALGNPANLHQVIDTSRNGNGPLGSEWCDPAGRAIGQAPTLVTGIETVDAFLWVKPPGEADGCAAAAGTFVPDLAYEMANNAG